MKIKIMNTWKYEKDFYLIPTIRLNFYEKKLCFFVAFLTFSIYNVYIDERDFLQEYYDQFGD